MSSAIDTFFPADAEDLRQLNLRIDTTAALLAALKRERDRKLDTMESRLAGSPGGALPLQTLLDQVTAERTGVSLAQVQAERRSYDALSIQGHELESGEPDVLW